MMKRTFPASLKVVLWTFVIALVSGPGVAAAEWEYELTPYVLGAGLGGDVTVKGVTAEVDVGFSDLIENMELGFMGALQARKGRWAVHGDLIFLGLGATEEFERDFRRVRAEVTGDVDME